MEFAFFTAVPTVLCFGLGTKTALKKRNGLAVAEQSLVQHQGFLFPLLCLPSKKVGNVQEAARRHNHSI